MGLAVGNTLAYVTAGVAIAGVNNKFTTTRRDGFTYSVDTLHVIRQQRGEVDLFFVTGADAMLEIFQWKDPEEVLTMAHLIAATRPGYDIERFEQEAPSRHPNVSVMDIPALAISSTDIRRRVAAGMPVQYLVPEGVKAYIEKSGLYRDGAGTM